MFLQNATIQYSSEYSVVLYRNFSATIQTVKSNNSTLVQAWKVIFKRACLSDNNIQIL